MNAPSAAAALTSDSPSVLARLFAQDPEDGRLIRLVEIGAVALFVAVITGSFVLLDRETEPGRIISPTLIAVLLIANLIPAIFLLVLLARRLALARVARGGLGRRGQLHTRLVALFSVVA